MAETIIISFIISTLSIYFFIRRLREEIEADILGLEKRIDKIEKDLEQIIIHFN